MIPAIQRTASERGQVLIFTAISMVMIFGMAAFAVDISQAVYTRRALQASSDAAALAGAQLLPNESNARTTAIAYSGVSGGKNVRAGHAPALMASGYPLFKCLTSTGIPCSPSNAIVVRQQSTVSTYFARLLGVSQLTVYATATASMKGGAPDSLDLIIILDTTASMDSNCSATVSGVSNPSRLDCALAGIRSLIGSLWPCPPSLTTCGTVVSGNVAKPLDKVGLMTFPGLTSTNAVKKEFDCINNVTSGDIADYDDTPIYTVVPLSSDYRTSTTTGLNGAVSNLVQAVDWGHGNGCGAQVWGGESRRRRHLLRRRHHAGAGAAGRHGAAGHPERHHHAERWRLEVLKGDRSLPESGQCRRRRRRGGRVDLLDRLRRIHVLVE